MELYLGPSGQPPDWTATTAFLQPPLAGSALIPSVARDVRLINYDALPIYCHRLTPGRRRKDTLPIRRGTKLAERGRSDGQ